MIDLHIHTSASDGQFSPAETVDLAWKAGVTALSVTDHDTTDGVAEASLAAHQYAMHFFTGIEISVQGEDELHILGYGIDPQHPALQKFCREQKKNREARTARLLCYLADAGVPITLEEVRQCNQGNASGRPHFARTLVQKGYVASVQEAFDRYLATPAFYQKVERPKPSPEEGISVLCQSGGVAVLAHPYLLHLNSDQLEALFVHLKACGLAGIEVYYSRHTPEQTRLYLRLAKKYDLFFTCGSDFHGPAIKPEIFLGTGINGNLQRSDTEILVDLQKAINARKQNS